jgi:hypothetical protein
MENIDPSPAKITLVVFTCAGREHLLRQTMASFKNACEHTFAQTILAIDGQIAADGINLVNPDIVVQSPARKGYVHNIVSALKMISTPYFFWLEDDWEFPVKVPMDDFLRNLNHDEVMQVILSKNNLDDSYKPYAGNYYIPADGFSANPGFFKTAPVKTGFDNVVFSKKDDNTKLTGFETFLNEYAKTNNLITLRYFLNSHATVYHSGELESTAREYHMINSLDKNTSLIDKEYVSGFGFEKKISLKNKAGMLFKLWLALLSLSGRLWSSREAYDFAFRIYQASLRKFKH